MLPTGAEDITIVKAMINLGKQFGHSIVAEGIESKEAYELLKEWGCDEGQGFWIARPMTSNELMAWLKFKGRSKH